MKMGSLARVTAPAVVVAALAVPALARELSGVSMPDSVTVGEKTLKLNGMGIRKKFVFKVYVAGLYLVTPSKDAAAILSADAPRVIRMQYVRDVDKQKIADAFREGFEKNTPDLAVKQKSNIDRMVAAVPEMKDGGNMVFTYDPSKGTTLSCDGKDVFSAEGKEFADAVFSLWLGPKPPSDDLKKGLLGD
jgi:hypothetical protein